MSAAGNFDAAVTAWAARESAVSGLVLVGSRVRAADDAVWRADAQSDWDFQLITSRPEMFATDAWLHGFADVRAYALRAPRIGAAPKINVVLADTEADFVLIPAGPLRLARLLVRLGLHRREGKLRRSLQNLALIIRPGWRFLKGAAAWDPLYRRLVADIADARLGDDELRRLADGFVCDCVGIRRKIARGELQAAQRLMHRDLAEVNFQLLHELRLRRGERTFPEARRIELIAEAAELALVSVEARLEGASLAAAVEKCAATCRALMAALAGTAWRWPDLS